MCLRRLQALDCFLAGDDVPVKKPDPSIYTLAARRLGVQPAECLVIEDSAIGLQVKYLHNMINKFEQQAWLVMGVQGPNLVHHKFLSSVVPSSLFCVKTATTCNCMTHGAIYSIPVHQRKL